MDTSEMRELLQGYLSELDWSGGASKDAVLAHLAGRDEALRTMVNQYVAEGDYQSPDDLLNVIPAQAWQDVQGDEWRGAESQYAEDVPSHFQEGPVGQDVDDVYRAGQAPPQTPGFGQSAGASESATGGAEAAGGATADAGMGSSIGAGAGAPRGGDSAGAADAAMVDATILAVDVADGEVLGAVVIDAVAVDDSASGPETAPETIVVDESGASAGSGGQ